AWPANNNVASAEPKNALFISLPVCCTAHEASCLIARKYSSSGTATPKSSAILTLLLHTELDEGPGELRGALLRDAACPFAISSMANTVPAQIAYPNNNNKPASVSSPTRQDPSRLWFTK